MWIVVAYEIQNEQYISSNLRTEASRAISAGDTQQTIFIHIIAFKKALIFEDNSGQRAIWSDIGSRYDFVKFFDLEKTQYLIKFQS